jgi:hexosaminidase
LDNNEALAVTRQILFVLLLLAGGITQVILGAEGPALVPKPHNMALGQGVFTITPAETSICYRDDRLAFAAAWLSEQLSRTFDVEMKPIQVDTPPDRNSICFQLADGASSSRPEGYRLVVTEHCATITASDPSGALYGAVTLLQLGPAESFRNFALLDSVPGGVPEEDNRQAPRWHRVQYPAPEAIRQFSISCVTIDDSPRFAWRGLLIDPARFYISIEEMKRYVDYMLLHKLNKLQIHFTDSQGWRIEIKEFPTLVTTGAIGVGQQSKNVRKYPVDDSKPNGCYYYTQEELKELVAYAAQRGVTIVPEIEMPGHTGALLRSCPQLLCQGDDQIKLGNSICVGQECTYQTLERILDEILEIFPGQYIHLGTDECWRGNWEHCRHCRAKMEELGIDDTLPLHGYFVERMSDYLQSKGRTAAGWDEIFETGSKPGILGMFWRAHSPEAVRMVEQAAKDRQLLVMTPTTHCYLDYRQAKELKNDPRGLGNRFISLEKAYSLEPIPDYLAPESHGNIVGLQGNLWGELLLSFPHMLYQTWPRACALAEVGWSGREDRDYGDFLSRLKTAHLQRLRAAGVTYREPGPEDEPGAGVPGPVAVAESGEFILNGRNAIIEGNGIRYYEPFDTIGYWNHSSDSVTWKLADVSAGGYRVLVSQAGPMAWKDNRYKLTLGEQQLIANVVPTDSMSEHAEQEIGTIQITRAGGYELSVVPVEFEEALMNLRGVRLIPVQ